MNYTYYRRYRPQKRRSGFKSFFWLLALLVVSTLILRACVSVINGIAEEKKDEAILSIQQGSAEVEIFGEKEPKPASDSQIILIGDSVRSSSGSIATLAFKGGSKLHMDENSHISFTEIQTIDSGEFIVLDLFAGRIWFEQGASEQDQFKLLLRTDVMNISSTFGEALISNKLDDEYIYVVDGQMNVDFVDRGKEDIVIESMLINERNKSFINDEKQRALLDRENLVLVEETGDDLVADSFLMWNLGTLSGLPVEEVEVEEEEQLTISIVSPSSPITVQEAIAIEGKITSGSASSVSVTWSGNGQAFELGLFEPGSDNFRYVADTNYANFAEGENTYTIIAFDSLGNSSNSVIVSITLNLEENDDANIDSV